MRSKQLLLATVGILSVTVIAMPASAQKSKDTLRVGFYQPVRLVDAFFQPGPEASLAYRMVFDTLVNYDAVKRKYVSGLVESWKRISPTTMEFKLKKGLKWSDGAPLTMDDVEYTYGFAMDPKVKYRFKATFPWHVWSQSCVRSWPRFRLMAFHSRASFKACKYLS